MPEELSPSDSAARERAQASARLVLQGIGLNALLAALKLAGGVLGHTYALIADGVESLLDVFSSILVWTGFQVAARPPDRNHPFGHGKAEPLSALAVTLFIFVAAGWVGWHAVHQITHPDRVPHWATLILLAFVIGVKVYFSRRVTRSGEQTGSTALGVEALHHYSDALTSAAAFIGIAIAVIGGPDYATADDWAALVACVVIAVNGVRMFHRAIRDVMDSAVDPAFEARVRELAVRVPGVLRIDKCRVRKSGLNYLVDIHVQVNGGLTVRAGHKIAHAVKDELLAATEYAITDVSVHVEPGT